MEEKNNQKQKEMTLDDLALIMAKGFDKSNKQTDKKIEALAILVHNEFTGLKSELKSDIKSLEDDVKGLKDDVKGLKDDVKEVKLDTENIKAELNKKVGKITHNTLTYRVEKLEEKFA